MEKLTFVCCVSFLFFSCSEPTADQAGSIDKEHKEYQLDSSGSIVHTDIDISDFTSAKQCMNCHQQHYEEWSNSFHAHSFDDPVFMSMWFSEKEHRPSTGVNFCAQCHSPAAFVSNFSLDGIDSQSDLEHNDIPDIVREGVSCDICHTMVKESKSVFTGDDVAATAEYYLNPGENVKYGSIREPRDSGHVSIYKPLFSSSFSCKPCHDQFIRGMPIEATVSEWESNAAFSMAGPSCQDCHMKKQPEGHSSHYFAGVDLLFYGGVDSTSKAYQQVVEMLQEAVYTNFIGNHDSGLDSIALVDGFLRIPVTVTNRTGHNMPSGTPFSREAWLECIVTTNLGDTIFSVGSIAPGDTLDYQDSDLMFFTAILYDQENQSGSVIYEPSNALSYTDHSLKIGKSETRVYDIDLKQHELEYIDELHIEVNMYFRAFKPQMLQQFHPSSVEDIPIIKMHSNSVIFDF